MFKRFLVLAVFLLVQTLQAQLPGGFAHERSAPALTAGGVYAPLILTTNGAGIIYAYGKGPVQSGQLLPVRSQVILTAIPAHGFRFVSWNPTRVFQSAVTVTNLDGSASVIVNNLSNPVVTNNIPYRVMTVRITPWTNIVKTPLLSISDGMGFQANFEPTPKGPALKK